MTNSDVWFAQNLPQKKETVHKNKAFIALIIGRNQLWIVERVELVLEILITGQHIYIFCRYFLGYYSIKELVFLIHS